MNSLWGVYVKVLKFWNTYNAHVKYINIWILLDPLKPEIHPNSIYKSNLFCIQKQVSITQMGQLKVFQVKSLF